ncbi:MAG TPA: nitroreductase [Bauldia sp.]|nr:nitroreductase [Bauldia sp.]
MPDALELLKTRKSISAPFLAEPGPSDAQLAEMIAIASRVPDHGKLTPWRFIVFKGEARKQASAELAALFHRQHPDATEKQLEEERKRLAQAPLVVIVVSRAAPHPKIPEWEQVLSAGNAAMNLVLASHALGFAAQWTTGWIAYDPDAAKILGLQPEERIVGVVHLGTPTVPPVERPRPAVADIVTYWKPSGG